MQKLPGTEDYRLLIEREWADIHHSRVQEWTALGVVLGVHLGLIELMKFAWNAQVPPTLSMYLNGACVISALFAVFGALVTCRHRQLMKVKLGWIYEAEEHIGLIKKADNPFGVIPENAKMKVPVAWSGLALPRLFSTSGLILGFYATLMIVDIVVLVTV